MSDTIQMKEGQTDSDNPNSFETQRISSVSASMKPQTQRSSRPVLKTAMIPFNAFKSSSSWDRTATKQDAGNPSNIWADNVDACVVDGSEGGGDGDDDFKNLDMSHLADPNVSVTFDESDGTKTLDNFTSRQPCSFSGAGATRSGHSYASYQGQGPSGYAQQDTGVIRSAEQPVRTRGRTLERKADKANDLLLQPNKCQLNASTDQSRRAVIKPGVRNQRFWLNRSRDRARNFGSGSDPKALPSGVLTENSDGKSYDTRQNSRDNDYKYEDRDEGVPLLPRDEEMKRSMNGPEHDNIIDDTRSRSTSADGRKRNTSRIRYLPLVRGGGSFEEQRRIRREVYPAVDGRDIEQQASTQGGGRAVKWGVLRRT